MPSLDGERGKKKVTLLAVRQRRMTGSLAVPEDDCQGLLEIATGAYSSLQQDCAGVRHKLRDWRSIRSRDSEPVCALVRTGKIHAAGSLSTTTSAARVAAHLSAIYLLKSALSFFFLPPFVNHHSLQPLFRSLDQPYTGPSSLVSNRKPWLHQLELRARFVRLTKLNSPRELPRPSPGGPSRPTRSRHPPWPRRRDPMLSHGRLPLRVSSSAPTLMHFRSPSPASSGHHSSGSGG